MKMDVMSKIHCKPRGLIGIFMPDGSRFNLFFSPQALTAFALQEESASVGCDCGSQRVQVPNVYRGCSTSKGMASGVTHLKIAST